MKKLISFTTFLFSFNTFALDMFVIKKNFSPRNVIHFKAHIKDCKFVEPYVSAYWVLGEKHGQIEGLNFIQKKFLAPIVEDAKSDEVVFYLNVLSRIPLEDSAKEFHAKLVDCAPKTYSVLGGESIEVSEIDANGKLSLIRGMDVNFVEIKGQRVDGSKYYLKIEE